MVIIFFTSKPKQVIRVQEYKEICDVSQLILKYHSNPWIKQQLRLLFSKYCSSFAHADSNYNINSPLLCLCVQNTYTNNPLVCAVGGDDGSIESDQRWQSLRHPVSYHRHGAEHGTDLQHGNTHPDVSTFTFTKKNTGKLGLALTHSPNCWQQSCRKHRYR